MKISQNSQKNTCVGVSFWQSCRPEGLQLYQKVTPTQVFSCEDCDIFKNTSFSKTPLIAHSGFLTKLAENNCEENHFSVEFSSEISWKWFLSLSCSISKNNSFGGFSQFLSFFKHVRSVSRTQSNIKMEPFAKIVNSSRGVFRTESIFLCKCERLKIIFSKSFILDVWLRSEYAFRTGNYFHQKLPLKFLIWLWICLCL